MKRLQQYRDQAWVLTGQLGGKALRLIGFMALARWLSPASFGTWMLYVTAFTLAEMARTGFVRQALVKLHAGASPSTYPALRGAAWLLTLGITGISGIAVWCFDLALPGLVARLGLEPFVSAYPIVGLLSLPFALSQWLLHARRAYRTLTLLDVSQSVLFYGAILLWPTDLTVSLVIVLHAGSYGAVSAVALLGGWTHVGDVHHASWSTFRELVAFGRHSVVTLITTNLLKSTDDLVIAGLLGPAAVALYNVPFKLRELADIPLRSFSMTAYPRMSTLVAQGRRGALADLFHRQVGVLTLLLWPALAVAWIWAEPLVLLLGGPSYEAATPILRCLLVAMALMPLDRYIGLALDSLGMPHRNARKVTIMTVINLGGNLLVLTLSPTLWHVAGVTVVGLLVGIGVGLRDLRPYLRFSPVLLLRSGPEVLVQLWVAALPRVFVSSAQKQPSSTRP